MRLTGCHKKNTRWFYLVFVTINDVEARSAREVKYLVKIVPMRVLNFKMSVSVKNFHLKSFVGTTRRAKVVEPVDGDIVGGLCQWDGILNAKTLSRKE